MTSSDRKHDLANPNPHGRGPKNNVVWMFVTIMVVAGLALIIFAGKSTYRQSASHVVSPPAATTTGSAPTK